MISLCMDSAYKHLVIGIYKDKDLLAGVCFEAFKKQSETIFVELERLLQEAKLDYKDIDRVVITKGPGSYTGIRIAMTIAKVLCSQMHIDLYTISTMQLYAGNQEATVILDARGNRAYAAHIQDRKIVGKVEIVEVDRLEEYLKQYEGIVLGDGYLAGLERPAPDMLKNFIDLEDVFEKVENVHALVPEYLKESDAYKV